MTDFVYDTESSVNLHVLYFTIFLFWKDFLVLGFVSEYHF